MAEPLAYFNGQLVPQNRVSIHLEDLGFFFSGVIPEMKRGDVLRMQYLNNVDFDENEIVTASDFGKELADYVVKEYRRIGDR